MNSAQGEHEAQLKAMAKAKKYARIAQSGGKHDVSQESAAESATNHAESCCQIMIHHQGDIDV